MSTYSKVCGARTKKTMQKAFDDLLTECSKKFGGTKRSHRRQQLANVGYFAGYYGYKTRMRVNNWLSTEHPVFGKKY